MPLRDCMQLGIFSGMSVAVACLTVLILLESTATPRSSIAMSLRHSQGAVLGIGMAIGPAAGLIFYLLKRQSKPPREQA